jgi:hypothetical protein
LPEDDFLISIITTLKHIKHTNFLLKTSKNEVENVKLIKTNIKKKVVDFECGEV